jgi:hypothetical protein
VPQLDDVLCGCEYYWVAAQAEYSTDVIFKCADGLRELYPRLLSHSTLCFGAQEVMNFLGRRLVANFRRLGGLRPVQLRLSPHRRLGGAAGLWEGAAWRTWSDIARSRCRPTPVTSIPWLRWTTPRRASRRWLRACADDPKKASAKVGRCFRRLHAHGLIAKIPRTRRWRVTDYGRKVMGTTMYLREHHFPNVYAGVMH